MDYTALLIFIFCGFSISSCSHFPLREYHYVNKPMTWAAAQRYCRTKYTDLATIESMDDINRLQPTFSYSWAWIGLRDDPISWKGTMGNDTNSWRWSATGETSKTGYRNWDAGQPDHYRAKELCGNMKASGKWSDIPCHTAYTFVCYTEINQTEKTYVFISARRTWADARDYCREHHTDLPMMESNEDNNKVYSTIPAGAGAWIGLYRLPWTWSDKTQSSFRSWQSTVPNNARGDEFCAIENTNHEWDDEYCWKEYPFICHQVLKLKTTVKLTFKTDADITDPAANAQILQQVLILCFVLCFVSLFDLKMLEDEEIDGKLQSLLVQKEKEKVCEYNFFISPQLGAMLTSQGWTDFKLGWKMEPRKQEKEN
ncbi:hypothetical protein ABVT39_018739 [Epinephelus coioides]